MEFASLSDISFSPCITENSPQIVFTEARTFIAERSYRAGEHVMTVRPLWYYREKILAEDLSRFFNVLDDPKTVRDICARQEPSLADIPLSPDEMTAEHHKKLCRFMSRWGYRVWTWSSPERNHRVGFGRADVVGSGNLKLRKLYGGMHQTAALVATKAIEKDDVLQLKPNYYSCMYEMCEANSRRSRNVCPGEDEDLFLDDHSKEKGKTPIYMLSPPQKQPTREQSSYSDAGVGSSGQQSSLAERFSGMGITEATSAQSPLASQSSCSPPEIKGPGKRSKGGDSVEIFCRCCHLVIWKDELEVPDEEICPDCEHELASLNGSQSSTDSFIIGCPAPEEIANQETLLRLISIEYQRQQQTGQNTQNDQDTQNDQGQLQQSDQNMQPSQHQQHQQQIDQTAQNDQDQQHQQQIDQTTQNDQDQQHQQQIDQTAQNDQDQQHQQQIDQTAQNDQDQQHQQQIDQTAQNDQGIQTNQNQQQQRAPSREVQLEQNDGQNDGHQNNKSSNSFARRLTACISRRWKKRGEK